MSPVSAALLGAFFAAMLTYLYLERPWQRRDPVPTEFSTYTTDEGVTVHYHLANKTLFIDRISYPDDHKRTPVVTFGEPFNLCWTGGALVGEAQFVSIRHQGDNFDALARDTTSLRAEDRYAD